MTTAPPWPPPAHIAATPIPPPRRPNSCTSVVSIRAPVAAIGWPRLQPLPKKLTRSSSSRVLAARGDRHRGERLVDLPQRHVAGRQAGPVQHLADRLHRAETGVPGSTPAEAHALTDPSSFSPCDAA